MRIESMVQQSQTKTPAGGNTASPFGATKAISIRANTASCSQSACSSHRKQCEFTLFSINKYNLAATLRVALNYSRIYSLICRSRFALFDFGQVKVYEYPNGQFTHIFYIYNLIALFISFWRAR